MWLTSSGNMCKHRKQNKTKQKRFGELSPLLSHSQLLGFRLAFISLWQIMWGNTKHSTVRDPILNPPSSGFSERSVAQFKFSTCFQSFRVTAAVKCLLILSINRAWIIGRLPNLQKIRQPYNRPTQCRLTSFFLKEKG